MGVAVLGRPVSQELQESEPYTAEVTRLCTDGTRNACTILYAAMARAAEATGFRKVITYILENEPGTSLKAAGWAFDCMTKGGEWDRKKRRRQTKAPTCPKQRWKKEIA